MEWKAVCQSSVSREERAAREDFFRGNLKWVAVFAQVRAD